MPDQTSWNIALTRTRRGFGRAQSGPRPGQAVAPLVADLPLSCPPCLALAAGPAGTGPGVGVARGAAPGRAVSEGVARATVVSAALPAATHRLTPIAPTATTMIVTALAAAVTVREMRRVPGASGPPRPARGRRRARRVAGREEPGLSWPPARTAGGRGPDCRGASSSVVSCHWPAAGFLPSSRYLRRSLLRYRLRRPPDSPISRSSRKKHLPGRDVPSGTIGADDP